MGVSEKQFSKHVKGIVNKKAPTQQKHLRSDFGIQIDNAVYRLGLASSRQASRQMVSCHIN